MNLVFLELDPHHFHLNLRLLDVNRNIVIPRLYIQLLNKDYEYLWQQNKIYPDLNSTAPQEYRL